MENGFDVFISYKRNGGAGWAEMLRLALIVYKNIPQERIFMDVHGGCGSDFKEKIKHAIANTTNVIVIFSKDFQNYINTDETNDVWLYELNLAVEHRRSIIPFIVDNLKREDIFKLQIPSVIYDIIEKNTCVHYNHDMPEGCIKSIVLKSCSELSVKIDFTSSEECMIRIPRLGEESGHYEFLNKDNRLSYTAFVDIGCDKELIFIAKRKNDGRWNEICYHVYFEEYSKKLKLDSYRNSKTDLYYEIPKGSMTYGIDIEWNIYDIECLQSNLVDPANQKIGNKPSYDSQFLSGLNAITKSI